MTDGHHGARDGVPAERPIGGSWLVAGFLVTVLLGIAAPFALLVLLHRSGHDGAEPLYVIALASVLLTLALIVLEGIAALRSRPGPRAPRSAYPPAGSILLAAEAAPPEVVVESVQYLLRLPYLQPLTLTMIYVDTEQLAAVHEAPLSTEERSRLQVLSAAGMTRGAALRTALSAAETEIIGVFDAGQYPQRDAFSRAWVWLSNGLDVVHAHRVVSNGGDSLLTRLLAVDGEAVGSSPWPISAPWDGEALWCEGNTYLRTRALQNIGADGSDLTYYLTFDRTLIAQEEAPRTLRDWWNQRVRREIAWMAVPAACIWNILLRSRVLRGWGIAVVDALLWRPAYAWLSLQVLTSVAFRFYLGQSLRQNVVPLAVLLALYVVAIPLVKSAFAWVLAPPTLRRHPTWFLWHFLASACFFGGLKGTVLRSAQLRTIVGPRRRESVVLPLAKPADLPAAETVAPDETPSLEDGTAEPAVLPFPSRDETASDEHEGPAEPLLVPVNAGHVEEATVIQEAHELDALVATLTARLQSDEAHNNALRDRLSAIEAEQGNEDAVHTALSAIAAAGVTAADVKAAYDALEAVAAHPNNLTALAALHEHTATLQRIVAASIAIQPLLEPDEVATPQAVPLERSMGR